MKFNLKKLSQTNIFLKDYFPLFRWSFQVSSRDRFIFNWSNRRWRCHWSHRRCFIGKGALRIFAKLTRKYLCRSRFFNKVADIWHRCSPVNFANFLRTLFYRTPLSNFFCSSANQGRFIANLGNSCYYESKKIATNWGSYFKSGEYYHKLGELLEIGGICYKLVHNS